MSRSNVVHISRVQGQAIEILGEHGITIVVTRIDDNSVELHFSSDEDCVIVCSELLDGLELEAGQLH